MSAPAIFLGHGSPMNAIERNAHTEAWAALGARFGRPKAILAISAHWYIRGSAVTAMRDPPTIHDFGGFPAALHAFDYPAPGEPALAARVQSLLAPMDVRMDDEWGLDHGTWAVLCHVYPQADVPVVQLAIDGTRPPQFHYQLGQRLAALRDEGVMLVGSGNVVHNLRVMRRTNGAGAYPWALQFNEAVREFLSRNEHAPLIDYHLLGEPAALSVPTPEHYLPMLYIAGARRDDDEFMVITDGIDLASVSMLSFAFARRAAP
jgi:4,5-DOPA dioxygenase extradiol